jgi:hypothetical protein
MQETAEEYEQGTSFELLQVSQPGNARNTNQNQNHILRASGVDGSHNCNYLYCGADHWNQDCLPGVLKILAGGLTINHKRFRRQRSSPKSGNKRKMATEPLDHVTVNTLTRSCWRRGGQRSFEAVTSGCLVPPKCDERRTHPSNKARLLT